MRRHLRENGLALFFLVLFLAAVGLQAVAGWHDFNNDQLRHHGPTIWFARYLVSSEFGVAVLENWQSEYLRTLQNWQSEFLAVGSMAILAVYLRQRGSPESKPVGAPRDATGQTG